MALEDLAMMRAVHGSTVLYPSDANQTAAAGATRWPTPPGIVYLRTTRGAYPVLYGPDETFPVGGSQGGAPVSDDDQVTVIGAGITLHEALAAADALAGEGIAVRVIDLYSVKPVDAGDAARGRRATPAAAWSWSRTTSPRAAWAPPCWKRLGRRRPSRHRGRPPGRARPARLRQARRAARRRRHQRQAHRRRRDQAPEGKVMATATGRTVAYQGAEAGRPVAVARQHPPPADHLGRACPRFVDEGVTGVTSNPTIFEKAVSGSTDYDEAMVRLVRAKRKPEQILWELMVEDIQAAADVFRPVHDETKGADGYVSIEVSPTVANSTPTTIAFAEDLRGAPTAPNVMVKIPATKPRACPRFGTRSRRVTTSTSP